MVKDTMIMNGCWDMQISELSEKGMFSIIIYVGRKRALFKGKSETSPYFHVQ